jgi:hypothetical protein
MSQGLLVLLAVLVAAGGFGVYRSRTDGRIRPSGGRTLAEARPDDEPVTVGPDQLGAPLGARATLLQFSSAFCQPCRTTRAVLATVSRTQPGIAHVEVDAESHLELVRRLGIRRTPTTLVLDAAGRELGRAVGVPRPDALLAAVAEIR